MKTLTVTDEDYLLILSALHGLQPLHESECGHCTTVIRDMRMLERSLVARYGDPDDDD